MRDAQGVSFQRSVTTVGGNYVRHLATILVVLGLWTVQAAALDRMGPAVSQLGQGKLSIGLDYAWSNADLDASGTTTAMSCLTNCPIGCSSTEISGFSLAIGSQEVYTSVFNVCVARQVINPLRVSLQGWASRELGRNR